MGVNTSRARTKKSFSNVPFFSMNRDGALLSFVFLLAPFFPAKNVNKPSWLSSNEVLCLFQVPSKPFLYKHSQNQLKEMRSKVCFILRAQSSAAELNRRRGAEKKTLRNSTLKLLNNSGNSFRFASCAPRHWFEDWPQLASELCKKTLEDVRSA